MRLSSRVRTLQRRLPDPAPLRAHLQAVLAQLQSDIYAEASTYDPAPDLPATGPLPLSSEVPPSASPAPKPPSGQKPPEPDHFRLPPCGADA